MATRKKTTATKAPRTPKAAAKKSAASKPAPMTDPDAPTIHRLKVTLKNISPPIWRTFEIPSDCSLAVLHDTLQTVMGWDGGHLHQFEAGGQVYGSGDMEPMDEDEALEGEVDIIDVLPAKGSKLIYDYDFGDGWRHEVKVVAIAPEEEDVIYPRCIAGARACPPEDCGGPGGYAYLLDILADKKHPEHKMRKGWLGGRFNPEKFDLKAINRRL